MPIEYNGTPVDEVSVNGQPIDEVTVNGQTVFDGLSTQIYGAGQYTVDVSDLSGMVTCEIDGAKGGTAGSSQDFVGTNTDLTKGGGGGGGAGSSAIIGDSNLLAEAGGGGGGGGAGESTGDFVYPGYGGNGGFIEFEFDISNYNQLTLFVGERGERGDDEITGASGGSGYVNGNSGADGSSTTGGDGGNAPTDSAGTAFGGSGGTSTNRGQSGESGGTFADASVNVLTETTASSQNGIIRLFTN